MYQIEITNRSAALENLSNGEDISKAWENIILLTTTFFDVANFATLTPLSLLS